MLDVISKIITMILEVVSWPAHLIVSHIGADAEGVGNAVAYAIANLVAWGFTMLVVGHFSTTLRLRSRWSPREVLVREVAT